MNKSSFWLLVLIVALGAGAYFYFGLNGGTPLPQIEIAPAPQPEPEIHYPIPDQDALTVPDAAPSEMAAAEPDETIAESAPVVPEEAAESAAEAQEAPAVEPLPSLDKSDTAMLDSLSGLFGKPAVAELIIPEKLIRNLVVTIDNAPREKMPERLRPVKPARGGFVIQGDQDHPMLSPDNYRRYAPYVALAESVDVDRLADLYIHYYPLFQEAYLDLGYPSGYFNDRLVEVIDRLLETPEIEGPLRLVRPHVLYQYADPELEALSAGQKVLLRIGPDNARRIKILLRDIRQRVTRFAPVE